MVAYFDDCSRTNWLVELHVEVVTLESIKRFFIEPLSEVDSWSGVTVVSS